MSKIHILPPQLTNQISAGEIVERPSSVVKELLENSLDANANRIDIEIESGGTKRIRVQDNGIGIAKDDLILALERHATSKIATLEDLENIMSMGFRGEALASISSVSRLIITSRIALQVEAWQVYSEGRYMKVSLQPTAHPIGTTVEVLDLFYNTPARRKSLRTEKTEFNQIDEIVRRIALARFDVAINLHHNNKLVRQYRAINRNIEDRYIKRLTAICGGKFVNQSMTLDWQNNDLTIKGWILDPKSILSPNPTYNVIQYCYVNGRIVRDRLINHAIRQAYDNLLVNDQQASYIVYLTILPNEVDVNVHPTKNQVYFYKERLVHDFVYQGVSNHLNQTKESLDQGNNNSSEQKFAVALKVPVPTLFFDSKIRKDNKQSIQLIKSKPDLILKQSKLKLDSNHPSFQINYSDTNVEDQSNTYTNDISKQHNVNYYKQQKNCNTQLATTTIQIKPNQIFQQQKKMLELEQEPKKIIEKYGVGIGIVSLIEDEYLHPFLTSSKLLSIYSQKFALIESPLGIGLFSLIEAKRYLISSQLTLTYLTSNNNNNYNSGQLKPSIIPIKLMLRLTEKEFQTVYKNKVLLTTLGFNISIITKPIILISSISYPLLGENLIKFFPKLLAYLEQNNSCQKDELINWIIKYLIRKEQAWTFITGMQLLSDFKLACPELVKNPPITLLQIIDLEALVTKLSHE